MSRVEELLAKYNPNGINDIPLWELTAWDKRFNAVDKSMQKKVVKYKYYLAKDLDELVDDIGDIRILYTNERVAYTSEEKCKDNICEGEIVAIPWGGTPTVKYYKGKFVTGDNRIATSLDTNRLNNKYLYYWMISQLGIISDYYRGAGIQHPSMLSVLSMQIPLPHIKVQEEIVKILDSFTNLIDALNEELSLRQKQFEYYREKLLTFDEGDKTTQRISMDELFYFKNGYTPSTKNSEYWTNGKINWFTVADFKNNNILYNSIKKVSISAVKGGKLFKPNSILLATTATIGIHALVCTEHLSNQQLTNLSIKEKYIDEIDVKYIYYYMYIIDEWCKKNYHGGGFMIVDIAGLKKMSIPIPSLAIQQSIVEKLDAFESLISSLKEEIALRQKQYEYYREKLLTFE